MAIASASSIMALAFAGSISANGSRSSGLMNCPILTASCYFSAGLAGALRRLVGFAGSGLSSGSYSAPSRAAVASSTFTTDPVRVLRRRGISALHIASGLHHGEPVGEDVPAEDDLQPQRDLVLALQVALTIRVTEADQLNRQVALHTPTDAVGEVTNDGANAGIVSLRGARNGVTLGDRHAHEVRHVRAEPKLRVSLLTGLASTVPRSEEHTSELQSRGHLVCRLL